MSSERRETQVRKFVLTSLAAAAAGGLLATVAGASLAKIAPPSNIAKAGKIVWCDDIEYPPLELYKGSTPVGADIDIAKGISAAMGVKAEFKNTVFDSIIASLLAKKCDAIISSMNDTPERRKAVDFVDYLKVGQSLMVKKGNPKHISSLASLSGRVVSVQTGTTNRDFLAAESSRLSKQGKKGLTIKTFPKDTDAISALKAGRVDAYFADSPVVAYYANQDSSLAIAGSPINPIAYGIAIRKHDPLRAAVQKAVNQLNATGAIRRIAAKWGMTKAVAFLK
jgi:polar amino acid transport system substrate-binding protein